MKAIGVNAILAALGGLAFVLLAPHVQAAGGTTPAAQAPPATTDVATLLAPLLAAATGIERIVEMVWSWVESAMPQTVAALGLGSGWAGYAHDEVLRWEGWLNQLARQARVLVQQQGGPAANPNVTSALARDIAVAQQKLLDAQQQLQSALKSQRYVSLKRSSSVLMSLVLGLITALTTNLDIFRLLGLSATAGTFGVILTGLIIGAGSGPVHSLIGLLQQARDVTDEAANLFSSRARQNATQALVTIANANNGAGTVPGAVPPAASRSLAPGLGPDRGMAAPSVAPAVPNPTPEQLRIIERLAER